MRSIADQFPEFNVTTFHEYYPFSDQVLALLSENMPPSLFSVSGAEAGSLPELPAGRHLHGHCVGADDSQLASGICHHCRHHFH